MKRTRESAAYVPQPTVSEPATRSISEFTRHLTTDYFVNPCHASLAHAALDSEILFPDLETLVPNLSAHVASVCHYLDVIDHQHIPESYTKPLEKPLIIPAILGYIVSVIVAHVAGIRVPLAVLNTWFNESIRAGTGSFSLLRDWLAAKELIEEAAAVKLRRVQSGVPSSGPLDFVRLFVVAGPRHSMFADGKRIIHALRQRIARYPHYFFAQLWRSLFSQLCCQIYTHTTVDLAVDPEALLDTTLTAASRVLSSLSRLVAQNEVPVDALHDLFASTSADLVAACVLAAAVKSLAEYFRTGPVTEDSVLRSSALLGKFHKDLLSYFRLLPTVSARDEKMLDVATDILAGRPLRTATEAVPIVQLDSIWPQTYSDSCDVASTEEMPGQGVVHYNYYNISQAHPYSFQGTGSAHCSLVKAPGSLKRLRDVLVSRRPLQTIIDTEDAQQPNAVRDPTCTELSHMKTDTIDIRVANTDMDQVVASFLLSDAERQSRRLILQAGQSATQSGHPAA